MELEQNGNNEKNHPDSIYNLFIANNWLWNCFYHRLLFDYKIFH